MEQINTKTLALVRELSRAIASSGLPPCVAGLALDRLRAQVSALEAQAVAREREARERETPPEAGG